MKKWIQKLVDQLAIETPLKSSSTNSDLSEVHFSEERATLLYLIDSYSKHIIETEANPARKVRESLDQFAKELLKPHDAELEKVLFDFRQFYSRHRIDEYSYVQKSFEEFRHIIWEFVAHLSEDIKDAKNDDQTLNESLEQLREAVELNSTELLKSHSKKFIDSYLKTQQKKMNKKTQRVETIKKNLATVKKQLLDANNSIRLDHLTQAFNRKSFDEQMKHSINVARITQQPVTLIMMDIDYFKKINDTFGHAIGDFVLIECVKLLKKAFARESDFVARIGGEEFAIILPDFNLDLAAKKAQATLDTIRKEVFVEQDMRIQFTASMGIAEFLADESIDQWMKRADQALYEAKKGGRDRFVLASNLKINKVA